MGNNYLSPLAKWARVLEIFIPAYMFGKSWGIADEKTVGIFRAQFPPFLIDFAEFLKGLLETQNENLERLFATSCGAVEGLIIIAALAVVIHFVVRDRNYIDSLRLTSVSLIPIAVLNGTVSHGVKVLVENMAMATQTPEALKASAVQSPLGTCAMLVVFYVTSLWMMGWRTGVPRSRRWGLIVVGLGFMALYVALGLMILPSEWDVLLPTLQEALTH